MRLPKSEYSRWMGHLSPALRLHEITLPGSHDSATQSLSGDSRTQEASIFEQLEMGVRYLDIRLDASTSDFRVVHGGVHGSGNTDQNFLSVARTIYRFLKGDGRDSDAHSTEVVVMQVKIDRGGDPGGFHGRLTSFLRHGFEGHSEMLHLEPIGENNVPALGQLCGTTGGLVLLRRYYDPLDHAKGQETNSSGTPVDYFADGRARMLWKASHGKKSWADVFREHKYVWPNSESHAAPHFNRVGMPFVIQDSYRAGVAEKKTLIETYLKHAFDGRFEDAWYLNFASTAGPRASSGEINPWLKDFLRRERNNCAGRLRFGTILMDYVDEDIVHRLIDTNFF